MIPRPLEPITFSVAIDRDDVVQKAVNTLNKMAESRYDGSNAAYVNNIQPEIDFTQDAIIAYDFVEEAIGNVAAKIEPYIDGYGEYVEGTYTFDLKMPGDWKNALKNTLAKKIETYIVQYTIARWLDRTSMEVIQTKYGNRNAPEMDKADELLRRIKGICELRQGKVHYGWNTTY